MPILHRQQRKKGLHKPRTTNIVFQTFLNQSKFQYKPLIYSHLVLLSQYRQTKFPIL